MHLLIDADIIAYRAAAGAEKVSYEVMDKDQNVIEHFKYMKEVKAFIGDQTGLHIHKVVELDPVEYACYNAKHITNTMIDWFKERYDHVTWDLYLTGSGNFRERMAVSHVYKGNRTDQAKPVHLPHTRDYLMSTWDARLIEGMEADDAIAMAQTEFGTCICTIDKDLNQVPGFHFNFVKQDLYHVSPDQGDFFFWKQMLTGDNTDNIKGVYGIGDVKAEKILSDFFGNNRELFKQVALQYAIAFDDPEQRIEENKQLLWMLRDESQIGERLGDLYGCRERRAVPTENGELS